MRRWLFPIGLVLAVGVLIAIFAVGNKPAKPKPESQLLGEKHTEQARSHIEPGTTHDAYNSELPSSGPHWPSPAAWGVQGQTEDDERYVHNLEHGGIWIAYRPDLPADQIQKIKDLANSLPQSSQFGEVKVVITSRTKNVRPIELAAWTYTLNLDSFNEQTIKQFYIDHLDKGPEMVP